MAHPTTRVVFAPRRRTGEHAEHRTLLVLPVVQQQLRDVRLKHVVSVLLQAVAQVGEEGIGGQGLGGSGGLWGHEHCAEAPQKLAGGAGGEGRLVLCHA